MLNDHNVHQVIFKERALWDSMQAKWNIVIPSVIISICDGFFQPHLSYLGLDYILYDSEISFYFETIL